MSFKKEYEIGLEDIGKEDLATNIAILKKLEDIAEQNSAEVGIGVSFMQQNKLVWLLLDWKINVIKRPKYREKIYVETWSHKMERCYGYREFEIYNENKELIVKGTSKWVLIDMERKRPIRVPDEYAVKYASYDKGYSVFGSEIEKIDETLEDSFTFVHNYEVHRRDIDVNQHMHNISYLELAYEVLPFDVYKDNTFNNIRISYKKELKYGDVADCFYTKVDEKHIIMLKSDDKVNAIIELY